MTDLPTRNTGVIQPSQVVKPTPPVELFQNTKYWLVASNTDSQSYWRINTTGALGRAANSGAGFVVYSDRASTAFAVFGTPVSAPEPATLGLLALGLLGGAGAGFAGRKGRN